MKQHALKEAFLDFTKEKLNRQVDDILSAMRFRGPGEREKIRTRLIEYLAAQMNKANDDRKKKGIQPLGDITALAIYVLAGMVKRSESMDDFRKNLVKAFGDDATPAVAIQVLGSFPWAWRFDLKETSPNAGKTGATVNRRPAGTDKVTPGLRGILAVLGMEWPEMLQIMRKGEYDYDLAHNTLVILPSPETIEIVMKGEQKMREILERRLGKMNIEVLDPGPLSDSQQAIGRSAYDYEDLTRERAFPGGFTKDDERCIGEMLSIMAFADVGEKEKTEKRLRTFLYSSMNAQNDIRMRKRQPLLKRVHQLPIYQLSRFIRGCASAETFLAMVKEAFPMVAHLHNQSGAISAAGPFPWAWRFDPKARRKKQTTAKEVDKQDVTQTSAQVENVGTPPPRETAPVKDATVIVLRTSPSPATAEEKDPEMAEMQRLKDRLTMLESVFKQHIHSKVDGSTYIPFDTAAEAIMFGGEAS